MKLVFRVDASVHIGTGHVMRCLVLAKALASHAECTFLCRALPGNLINTITKQGFSCIPLPGVAGENEGAEAEDCLRYLDRSTFLIIDHYGLGERFGQMVRPNVGHIMVIDDLANRRHECDILLDQNLFTDYLTRYDNKVPPTTLRLLGPRFALLRDEFFNITESREERRILVGFGGADEHNLTLQTFDALITLKKMLTRADIVVGRSYPYLEELTARVAEHPWAYLHVSCNYMASLMAKASVMVGSGGTTHWERCISGLPGLIITAADNQVETTSYLHQLGVCRWLGEADKISQTELAHQLEDILADADLRKRMSRTCKTIIPPGSGPSEVVKAVSDFLRG